MLPAECTILLGPVFSRVFTLVLLVPNCVAVVLAIEREKQVRIWYGSQIVGKHNLDLIVEGMAIVELKANHGSLAIHGAQLRSYLRATDCAVGILVNFGMPTLQLEVLLRQEIAENSE